MTNTENTAYTVKITAGFEQAVRYAGRYATKPEAIAAARAMKSAGAGAYCVAVPAKHNTATPAQARMTGRIEVQTTAQMFAVLDDLDVLKGRLPASHPEAANLRLVAAAVSDVITAREGIDDQLAAIFLDDDYTGTYTEAMRRAIAMRDEEAKPLFAVWTPEDFAQTVRDANAHRANPSNVVDLDR